MIQKMSEPKPINLGEQSEEKFTVKSGNIAGLNSKLINVSTETNWGDSRD